MVNSSESTTVDIEGRNKTFFFHMKKSDIVVIRILADVKHIFKKVGEINWLVISNY